MATKLPRPLVRSTHLSGHGRGTPFDPNSPTFDPTGPKRQGDAGYRAVGVDMEEFYRPMERLHAIAAHGSGIGQGLNVSAIGQTSVRIEPGIAIDPQGRHIYLATDGSAETNPKADVPFEPRRPVVVGAAGLDLTTPMDTGDLLLTLQWWETFDEDADTGANAPKQFRHTPWVRFVKPADHQPDTHVVLAKLTLDASGRITALDPGTGATSRQGMDFRAQRLRLERGTKTGGLSVGNQPAGAVEGREGGIQLSVPGAQDTVRFVQGESGRFAQVQINANQVGFGQLDAPAVTVSPADAQVSVGGGGVPGKVKLRDGQGTEALRLDAATGSAAVKRLDPIAGGAIAVGGDLALGGSLKASSGTLKVASPVDLGGALSVVAGQPVSVAGDLAVTGSLRGASGQALAVAGNLVVNGRLMDNRGLDFGGNPARKVEIRVLTVNSGQRLTVDVNLGRKRPFTAFCFPAFSQPVAANAEVAFAAEVFAIDTVPTAIFAQGLGSFSGFTYSVPCVKGEGQFITFRASALGRQQFAGAVGIVFYE